MIQFFSASISLCILRYVLASPSKAPSPVSLNGFGGISKTYTAYHTGVTGSSDATSLPFAITPDSSQGDAHYRAPSFPIQGFEKYAGNPIISPVAAHDWESAYTYNPSAIVIEETIFLLYRAQNASKTSSIGLGWSTDGIHFTRLAEPILYATEPYEHIGGTEDPRVIRVNGTFYLTYTGYDNTTARMCLATSTDLLTWTKYGPLFPDSPHSKSGAIVDEKVNGLYHMYLNDTEMYHATSPDLITWTLTAQNPFAVGLDGWDGDLVEPGPAPVKTDNGSWLLVYNGKSDGSDPAYANNSYSTSQMLIDPEDYGGPLERVSHPFLTPTTVQETQGQVPDVVFSEGLVQYKGKWFLYYGQADTTLGVAIAPVRVSDRGHNHGAGHGHEDDGHSWQS